VSAPYLLQVWLGRVRAHISISNIKEYKFYKNLNSQGFGEPGHMKAKTSS